MIIVPCEQGSDVWQRARMAIPTCSAYDRILTSERLQRSASAGKYRGELLAEWLYDAPIDFTGAGDFGFTERGKQLEAEARKWYQFDRDVEVSIVGFVKRDDGQTGGSPDGLVGDDGGLEIKVPALHTFLAYFTDPALLVKDYRGQVQGYLHVTGRWWWDLLAYHPDLPPVVQRIERDAKYQEALERELAWFCQWLADGKEKLAPYRSGPAEEIPGSLGDLLERSVAAGFVGDTA